MRKKIQIILIAVALTFGVSSKAYGVMEGYIVKNGEVVCDYSKKDLIESFLDFTEGEEAPLYNSFKEMVKGKGVHMFYDSKGKYVSFKEIEEAFISKIDTNQAFDLNSELEKANKAETPALIENIKVENKAIVKELVIAKEGIKLDGAEFLKDKYKKIYIKANDISLSNIEIEGHIVVDPGLLGKVKLNNVKCKDIEILSGDNKGIYFSNVKSDNVKIDKNIGVEIQYEGEITEGENTIVPGGNAPSTGSGNTSGGGTTPTVDEGERIKMLQAAQSQLNSTIKVVTNENEKAILLKLKEGVEKAIDDKNYKNENDIKEVEEMYDNLTQEEKNDLSRKLLQNMNLTNIYNLINIYGLE